MRVASAPAGPTESVMPQIDGTWWWVVVLIGGTAVGVCAMLAAFEHYNGGFP